MRKILMITMSLLGCGLSALCLSLMDSLDGLGSVVAGFFAVALPTALLGLVVGINEKKLTKSDEKTMPWCMFMANGAAAGGGFVYSDVIGICFLVLAAIGLVGIIIKLFEK